MDETIIELVKEVQEEEDKITEEEAQEEIISESIQKGILIMDDDEIVFEERLLMDGKIAIRIPNSFDVLPQELMMLKYPNERRPQLILTDDSFIINVTFNHTNSTVVNEEIENFKTVMLKTLQSLQPDSQYFENGVKVINGRNVGFFDVLSRSSDGEIYNWMFCVELEGRALLCSLNCTADLIDIWKPIFKGVMDSFRVCQPLSSKEE